jgi:hypothetical protein
MTVTSLMGHRPYRDRHTDDLLRDRAYFWSRSNGRVLGPEEENFAAMRLHEVEAELRFRGHLTEFRAPPPART